MIPFISLYLAKFSATVWPVVITIGELLLITAITFAIAFAAISVAILISRMIHRVGNLLANIIMGPRRRREQDRLRARVAPRIDPLPFPPGVYEPAWLPGGLGGNVPPLAARAAVPPPIDEALVQAATIGDLASLNRILALPASRARVAGGQNLALMRAAQNGHLAVLDALLAEPRVSDSLLANNNHAILAMIEAVRHGHFPIVQRLAVHFQVATHINALNNEVLRSCAEVGNVEIFRFLLNTFPALQRTAGDYDNAALCVAAANGHAAIVRELLMLDSVVRQITAQENFAYRIAQIHQHDEVLAVLMQFPEVEDYRIPAQQNQRNNAVYTPSELRGLAARVEGSMDPLNAHENVIFEGLKSQYRATVQTRGGAATVLNEFRLYLETQYPLDPAIHNGRPLPLDCRAARAPAQREAYYNNVFHTAYRYLFLRPNPLNHPGRTLSMTPESHEVLACFWLAIHDNTRFPSDSSLAERKEMFAGLVRNMARGHNYDRHIPHPVTGIMGYHDDLEGDKPTCAGGVNKRMMLDACLILALKSPPTPDNVKRKAQEELVEILTRKIALLTTEQRIALRDALTDLAVNAMDRSELTPEQRTTLDRLSITPGELSGFTYQCREYFGATAYSGLPRAPIKLEGEKQNFATYEALGNYFAKNIVAAFYVPLSTAVANSLPEESPAPPVLNQFPARVQAGQGIPPAAPSSSAVPRRAAVV